MAACYGLGWHVRAMYLLVTLGTLGHERLLEAKLSGLYLSAWVLHQWLSLSRNRRRIKVV